MLSYFVEVIPSEQSPLSCPRFDLILSVYLIASNTSVVSSPQLAVLANNFSCMCLVWIRLMAGGLLLLGFSVCPPRADSAAGTRGVCILYPSTAPAWPRGTSSSHTRLLLFSPVYCLLFPTPWRRLHLCPIMSVLSEMKETKARNK